MSAARFNHISGATNMFSRRDLLALSAAGAAAVSAGAQAATVGNPDEPAQGAINAKSPGRAQDKVPDMKKFIKKVCFFEKITPLRACRGDFSPL